MPVKKQSSDLYIYYVKGRVGDSENRFGNAFIGNWQEDDAAFLFFDQPADDQVAGLVDGSPCLELVDRFCMSYSDWHGGEILPFSTDRFYVAPPWENEKSAAGKIPLVIDPGVVFGSGNHTTTRFCLEAVERAYEKAPPRTVVDMGTGTGLLGLAAAALGSSRVLALDSNFLAVRTAKENIERNKLGSKVLAVQADAISLVDCPADLLIANIHFDVMRQLTAAPAFYEKKWFVLSGLLRSQARYIEQMFYYGPGRILQRWTDDGIWYTYLAAAGH